jgi:hydrogenase maturation protein HypF
MNTWHIHIQGRVQGVGFRPFVYRLAKAFKLNGSVANTANGVHIYIHGTKTTLKRFIRAIHQKAPPASTISKVSASKAEQKAFTAFEIVQSYDDANPRLLITPDIALCKQCRADMFNPNDRRFHYAFTTCTQCGPRYSIMTHLPYDRNTTTMEPYTMCPNCLTEYTTEENRRFYSQTNSCPACGIKLSWLTDEPKHTDAVAHAAHLLKQGKIVAVKGIGGFLLLADATQESVIDKLRKRKNRPKKPFALLFRSAASIANYARLTYREQKLLESEQAPIVLLRLRNDVSNLAVNSIAPGLNRIGAMLPYAPLLDAIMHEIDMPLVATSANVTGSPIVYEDVEAKRVLSAIADAILTNDRDITFPQDDSVALLSKKHQQSILLRRSRGLAPSLAITENTLPADVLAFGAEMKSAFGLTSRGHAYLSQYLGNTNTYESQKSYEHVFENLLDLLKPEIKKVAIDAHPDYHTSRTGIAWAQNNTCELVKVQHHRAHFGAILAEHGLLQGNEPVLGVIWDGTGYGDDGNIWGGEFFIYENGTMSNGPKVGYYPHVLNDRMATHPPVATLAAMWPLDPGKVWMRKYFSEHEQEVLPQVLDQAKIYTSSVGRLFDAVAGLFEICPKNNFEGEAAMLLQHLAEKSKLQGWQPYCLPIENKKLSPRDVLERLKTDKKAGIPVEDLALRFHQTLVQWIAWVADTEEIKRVAFSGGVFQNSLLVDMIIDRLAPYHELYFHEQLSPNDENIAVGQIAMTEIDVENSRHEEEPQIESDLICV